MPRIHPFRAVRFTAGPDQSTLIAPPYDVLDAAEKARLLERNPDNIVAIDLPHTPAKALGPPACYAQAAATLARMLAAGTLHLAERPAIFAYRQTFTDAADNQVQRHGMGCCVDTVPFGPRAGGGVLPHEETFSGPKEDRLALMRATRAQLSPIFSLHADARGLATALIRRAAAAAPPDTFARTDDGTLHEVWAITDPAGIEAYQQALDGEDIYIADGHHRYNTALNYLGELEAEQGPGEAIAPDHPARRCMMVLVGMSDPGLVIWPTHRVLGGMRHYTFDAFLDAIKPEFMITPIPGGLNEVAAKLILSPTPSVNAPNLLGLFDFASGRGAVATTRVNDPLEATFADRSRAWRTLDVAIIQHIIVEGVCQPRLNDGQPVRWAFPHRISEVAAIGAGRETGAGGGAEFAQLAILVRPTPLAAVREVSSAGGLMPQKSTFFYPKVATGLFIHPFA